MKQSVSNSLNCSVQKSDLMRYLDLNEFRGRVEPTPPSEVGEVLLCNRYRSRWPDPQTSLRLLATMVWPNEKMKRERLLDAFTALYGKAEHSPTGGLQSDGSVLVAGRNIKMRELGAVVVDQLDPDITAAQIGLR